MDSEYITYSIFVVRKLFFVKTVQMKKHIIHNHESIQYKK